MKIYLVGGAVRDEALGIPIKEKDWVVVGGTKETLIDLGFKQVGSDFPVFLHPKTKEEYALARTERKTGVGYYGFVCDADSHVTLEDDLLRRDLTLNAMAKDTEGHLIDPYHGMDDIKAKQLKHVSPAFAEDPVRVLRVARFAARFHVLGFTVADETMRLMAKMAGEGELLNLVPERVWQEWQVSLEEKSPWVFLDTLRECGALSVIFPELKAYPNLAHVAGLSTSPKIRFVASVLDMTVESIDHLCQRLHIPRAYYDLAILCLKFADTIPKLDTLTAKDIVLCFEHMDAFRREVLFKESLIALEANKHWLTLYEACKRMTASTLNLTEKGAEIKLALRKHRIDGVASILNEWEKNEK